MYIKIKELLTMFPKFRSKYELQVGFALQMLNIPYTREISFNHPWVSRMRYDFYLPYHNVLIEVDGEQHFKQVKKFQPSIMDWMKGVNRDVRKSSFALSSGFRLLRISYNNIKNVMEVIRNFLCGSSICSFSDFSLYTLHISHLYQYYPIVKFNIDFALNLTNGYIPSCQVNILAY